MTELKINCGDIGKVQVDDDVIAIIAGTAALEVEGITPTGGNITNDFVGRIGKKNFARGVKVSIDDCKATIDLSMELKFGYKISDVTTEVQRRVKSAVETMTGLEVVSVNVNVVSVNFEKQKKSEEE
jgi:uncharacterized alkaline shock family protein YloU